MAQFYHVRDRSPSSEERSELASPKRGGVKTALPNAFQFKPEMKNPFLSESYFELFKLMMTAFKNSSALRLSDCDKVLSLMRENGMAPDIRIYNVMLASCERKSMWRRAIRFFHAMRMAPDRVEPNAQTLEILLSCCRHAVEEPGTIYALLRKEDLPHE
jgi:pentatricopeptide repeat protein